MNLIELDYRQFLSEFNGKNETIYQIIESWDVFKNVFDEIFKYFIIPIIIPIVFTVKFWQKSTIMNPNPPEPEPTWTRFQVYLNPGLHRATSVYDSFDHSFTLFIKGKRTVFSQSMFWPFLLLFAPLWIGCFWPIFTPFIGISLYIWPIFCNVFSHCFYHFLKRTRKN